MAVRRHAAAAPEEAPPKEGQQAEAGEAAAKGGAGGKGGGGNARRGGGGAARALPPDVAAAAVGALSRGRGWEGLYSYDGATQLLVPLGSGLPQGAQIVRVGGEEYTVGRTVHPSCLCLPYIHTIESYIYLYVYPTLKHSCRADT